MRLTKLSFCVLILCSFIKGQSFDPLVEDIMNQTNLDSLTKQVRVLSGEDSVVIGSTKRLIKHRIDRGNNDIVADYIEQKLNQYELQVFDQSFDNNGRNVIAIQEGLLFPDKQFIICAHYDAVDYHCADDNASGSAAVLEAARILSNYDLNYSLIYALWDQEETGLFGSKHFIQQIDSNQYDIQGVLNIDMIGWDGDNDGLYDLHVKKQNSKDLASFIVAIDSIYNLPINAVIYNPGTSASDHSPFWDIQVPSVLLIEAYYGGDFNPFYHSKKDRINLFNLPYFYSLSQLAIGATASLIIGTGNPFATSIEYSTEQTLPDFVLSQNYPNPFNPVTKIKYIIGAGANNHSPVQVNLSVFNLLGQKVATLVEEQQHPGSYIVQWDAGDFVSGVYYYQLQTGKFIQTRKLVLMK